MVAAEIFKILHVGLWGVVFEKRRLKFQAKAARLIWIYLAFCALLSIASIASDARLAASRLLFNLARDIRCGFQKTYAARKSFALSLIVSHESIFALQLIACVPRRNAVLPSFLRLRFAIVGMRYKPTSCG